MNLRLLDLLGGQNILRFGQMNQVYPQIKVVFCFVLFFVSFVYFFYFKKREREQETSRSMADP